MDKEYIIKEIIRTAKENEGLPLGVLRFESITGIKKSDWYGKYWSKWGDALKAAGYEPNELQTAYDEEFIMRKIISLIREIGRFPTDGEFKVKAYNDKSFPAHSTILKRIGNIQERIKRLIKYCEEHDNLSDVIAICKTYRIKKENNSIYKESSTENFGFVYLMKSGKHYKIGRSSSADRREYELKLLLPEKVDLIHKIRTDDPVGIEAYWHKRFEDKRKSGEWFALTGADVQAFKRRKFM